MTANDPFATPSPDRDSRRADAFSGPTAQGGYEAPGPAGYGSPAAAPYASQPSYGPPQNGQPAHEQSSTDGVSIAALVTGLVGLGPVAAVLGAIGLRRTAGGQRKGTAMAVAGFILGMLGTIVATVAITWWAAAASDFFESDAWTGTDLIGGSTQTYGDDPSLDALWDECDAGDDAACDDLFYESPVGSEYEDFGYTCGERGRGILQFTCDGGDSE